MEKVFNRKLKKLIDSHDVVSFDIFDTLIKRNCMYPTDVFQIVENRFNLDNNKDKIENFKTIRINAENKARSFFANNEDVTLDQIYKFVTLNNKEKLKRLEIETELEICQVNYGILDVYKYCVDTNKQIICISDMYLNKEIIMKILDKAGYDNIKKVYVSSELNKTKIKGSIFKYVMNDMNIKNTEIIHIGDSWKADYISTLRLNIKSFHVKKNNYKKIYINKINSINENIMFSFLNNNKNKIVDEYEKIGYETIGPLCLNFCYWVNYVAKEYNIENLLFCARDMKMIQEIYNEIFGNSIKNSYFYVSRKSTYLPYLYVNQDYESFRRLIPFGKRKINIKELMSLFNIVIDEDILEKYGLSKTEKYDLNELQNNKSFIEYYKKEIIKFLNDEGKKQYKNFLKYLETLNIDDKTSIVDLGWRGTTQDIMISILKKNIYGMYLGLHKLNGNNLNDNYYTYLFYGKENGYSDKVYSFMSLCELLLSALHGSTVGYNDFLEKPYILNKSANEKNEYIINIQKGAIRFVSEFKKYNKYLSYNENDKMIIDSFINIGINPSYTQAKKFGNIYTENLNTRRLCNYKGFRHYLFHLGELKNDFVDSEWKIGFFKLLFKVPLPYFDIYIYLKKKSGG